MLRSLILFTLILYSNICTNAQSDLSFSIINSKDGLSDNRVRDIIQLQDGRMIVCTVGITNIFDGTAFKQLHEQSVHVGSLVGNNLFNQAYTDKQYLWIKTKNQIRLINLNIESFVSNPDSVLRKIGNGEKIIDFYIDINHNYWMVTSSDKLLLRPSNSSKVIVFKENISYINSQKDKLTNIAVIKNEVFIFYKSGLNTCYDIKTQNLNYQTNSLSDDEINLYGGTLKVAQKGDTIYTLHSGRAGILKRYISKKREWSTILKTDNGLRTISIDNEKNIWLTSKAGLWKLNEKNSEIKLYKDYRLVDGSKIATEAFALYNDKQGGLWIGTLNHGLLYYHPDRFKFRLFGKTYFIDQEADIDVNCFLDLSDNKILVGTSNGLYILDKLSGRLTIYEGLPIGINCLGLIPDKKNNIWITSSNRGLYKISGNKVEFATPHNKPIRRINTLGNKIFMSASNLDAWMLDQENNTFKPVKFISTRNLPESITQIIPFDNSSLLGISTEKVFLLNVIENKISYPLDSLLKKNIKPYTCCAKDSRGLVWLGTMDGLYIWNVKSNKSYVLFTDNGIVNNNIKGLLEDLNGKIWVTTAGGISQIDVTISDSEIIFGISNFNHFDGVINNEFIAQSAYRATGNLLFFGGINGFNVFDLNKSWGVRELSKPLFTNLALFGIPIKTGEKYDNRIILTKSITSTDTLKLKHNQNSISLWVSALNYINPSQTYYRYRLVDNNNQWNEISTSNGTGLINFTNLQPGTYKLQVKAANNSKEWSDNYALLTIIIQPPYWKTAFAYVIYLLLFILLTSVLLSGYKRRTQIKLARKNEEKLNKMKFDFFTNISHEFRTPLTLIITPLESILKDTKGTVLENKIQYVWKHAKDLLNLVNQLLDYRRLEVVGEKLNLTFGNIAVFIDQFKDLFEKIAEDKKMRFVVSVPDQEIWMYFDQAKLYRIINNLLSNAFKFTPEGGEITVKLLKEVDTIKLEVVDNGIGIPENEISNVFNSFYQVNLQQTQQGSGIGLHLVNEYVKLHMGEITVESEPNVKTVFRITLPAKLSPTINKAPETLIISEEIKEMHKILVVEDNFEMRGFITSELKHVYLVYEANNGIEGVNKAKSIMPDIIISDVMMPEMDGHEMCKAIKSNIDTSHIPIILLTAKASDDNKYEGYKSGADEYISKPFNLEFLKLRINQLIDLQNKRKKQFKSKIEVNPSEINLNSLDELFLKKALENMELNMSNSDYSVSELSNDMNMDRTVLYRKLQSITGLTPIEFIRMIRLKRAAQILNQGQYPISEVASMVGFNTQKYFTKYFKDAFGVTPSQFKNSEKS